MNPPPKTNMTMENHTQNSWRSEVFESTIQNFGEFLASHVSFRGCNFEPQKRLEAKTAIHSRFPDSLASIMSWDTVLET